MSWYSILLLKPSQSIAAAEGSWSLHLVLRSRHGMPISGAEVTIVPGMIVNPM